MLLNMYYSRTTTRHIITIIIITGYGRYIANSKLMHYINVIYIATYPLLLILAPPSCLEKIILGK